ncbi:MerR family transcriptional regulator [Microbacterium halotolerans]|uniref:MerR family transcriptional regulator n=1 Tax=Microbacterium halotolerans TaxID=246613 RepID=UPI0013C2B689|nr:MerR family transcriptional regulator [Microbacterium halotolerans]
MTNTDDALLLIGDVARRTGLSVSAIRYYSDEGLVAPTDETDAGHRLYDLDAVARFEYIRTLRDLDAGLAQVREALDGTTSLSDVLAAHLDVLEGRAALLQEQRAVLRALVRNRSGLERARVLRRLATMSDVDRRRLIDDFWESVASGLPAGIPDHASALRPQLPADPTAEQLDAWITLSELLASEQFRDQTREYMLETYGSDVGREMSKPAVQEFIASTGGGLMAKLMAAREAGLPSDDPAATALADEFVRQAAAPSGTSVDDVLRTRLADRYRDVAPLTEGALDHDGYRATHGRYLELTALINGQPHPDAALAEVLDDTGAEEEQGVGPWLAAAIMGTVGL